MLKKLCEPWKILLKEANRFRILMQARDRMNPDSPTAECVIATGPSADGDGPNGGPTKGDTSNGAAADCNEDADGTAAERKEADGQTADRENATCQAATREPAGRHVTQGEDGASMTTPLPLLPIRTDRNSPKR